MIKLFIRTTSYHFLIFYRFWIPKTIQEQVHILIMLLTITRASFFVIAIYAWDDSLGEVDRCRTIFYALDELATVAFFSLTCTLALFWAEVYYISVDRIEEYQQIVRPITFIVNILAYLAVIVCTVLAVRSSDDDSDYIYWNFSILVAILYLIGATIFGSFAYLAAAELSTVPLQITTRQERMDELYKIFYTFLTALCARATVLLVISSDSIGTSSTTSMMLILAYFIAVEFVPTVFAVVFYRVQEEGKDGYLYEPRSSWEETAPLTAKQNNSLVADVNNLQHLAKDEVVSALIAKLNAGTVTVLGDDQRRCIRSSYADER